MGDRGQEGIAGVRGQWSVMCEYMCALPLSLECTDVELWASLCESLRLTQRHGERLEGSVGPAILLPFCCFRLHLGRTCSVLHCTSCMIMRIKPAILSRLYSLNCRPIIELVGKNNQFLCESGQCKRPSDLVVANYMLNVKSSTL